MTIFEKWVTETVANIVRDAEMQTQPITAAECAQHGDIWKDVERRAAILLVQARALECRHLAAELQINGRGNSAAREIVDQLLQRSSKLEAIGMMLAKGPWPIPDQEAPRLQVVTH